MRLIMGGRAILHARCQACHANLLDEVMTFEAEVAARGDADAAQQEKPTQNGLPAVAPPEAAAVAPPPADKRDALGDPPSKE